MSLRVNLILAEEQRSGSKLNMKSLLRISRIVGPALLVLLIGQQALSCFLLSSQLDILESQWSAIEPKQKLAIRLTSRLSANLKTKAELDAWAAARPAWHRILAAIMEAAPDSVQLTSLRVELVEDKTKPPQEPSPPVRQYQMTLDGVTRDVNSMLVVQSFEKNLLTHPELEPLIESVKVANFAADVDSGDEWSRIFSIECRLLTLPPKEKP